ncbi:hypothetical protein AP071_08780 [Rhodobacter capsulatus]|nr:hypothetical protein AP071_08780 [Rhodobacter capsulatus]KQB16214.1 hypothetical protein AP073_11510 [Rhodobacter capsulatus]
MPFSSAACAVTCACSAISVSLPETARRAAAISASRLPSTPRIVPSSDCRATSSSGLPFAPVMASTAAMISSSVAVSARPSARASFVRSMSDSELSATRPRRLG